MRWVAVLLILSLAAACAHAQTGALLHAAESLDGVSLAMGAGYDESRLFLSHAAEHVAEGAAAIGAVSRAPEDATGSTYVSFMVNIEPTDFTEQALVFDAASSTPGQSKGFYVRGYNEAGAMVLSWMTWSAELPEEVATIHLTPGADGDGLAWEPGRIESDDHSAVTRLEFIVGTREPGAHFNLIIDSIRASIAR
ncbi:MAG: hypothetical protein ACLFU7_07065 [Armatimonadota bacterium]